MNQIEFGISEKGQKGLENLAKQFGFKNKFSLLEAIADGRLEIIANDKTEELVADRINSISDRMAEKARSHAITELDSSIALLRSFQDDIRNCKREII